MPARNAVRRPHRSDAADAGNAISAAAAEPIVATRPMVCVSSPSAAR